MKKKRGIFCSLILLFLGMGTLAEELQAQTVTQESLLNEMLDRDALTHAPNYICRQASSYDRAAVSPDNNWFANADFSQFLRTETNNGREEWVLLDVQGAGAIVRWWITAGQYLSNVYLYLDGSSTPVFEGNIADWVGGEKFAAPLSRTCANGRDLYLPIPFAKGIKITCDKMPEQNVLYYQINYRLYSEGVDVESLTPDILQKNASKIDAVNQTLLNPNLTFRDTIVKTSQFSLSSSSKSDRWNHTTDLPQEIAQLQVKVQAEDLPAALRNTVMRMTFDDKLTVWCPIGDFFGSGVGLNPNQTWYTRVASDGTLTCFWPMPFQKSAQIEFLSLGDQPVTIEARMALQDRPWTEDSLYFHCFWRQERGIETREATGTQDWNYAEIQGQGLYVGDILSIHNFGNGWWGEGDEKIYVDGETFPSHFGTGTEDYYGYAWCTPEFFEAPFLAQPRAEGPGNFGHATNLRFRSLDGIPFTKSFKFDMEVWHWLATTIDYAVATFWYGSADSVLVNSPGPDMLENEASQKVDPHTQYELSHNGLRSKSLPEGELTLQGMAGFNTDEQRWVGDRQIWWKPRAVGNRLALTFNLETANPDSVTLGLTRAKDYGTVQFFLNGEPIGQTVDLYIPDGVNQKLLTIDQLPEIPTGENLLEIEIVGKNEQSAGLLFGIDRLDFSPSHAN